MTVHHTILIKYGGNAMTDQNLKTKVLRKICSLKDKGHNVLIVHGGGPFIKQTLKEVNIESQFIDGLRKTTPEAMEHVEMTWKSDFNNK